MRRATEIKRAGTFDANSASDRVLLDADDRHRRRIMLTAENGTTFLLDLSHAVALRDGDGLVLDDGSIVGVAGRPEHLVEIDATTVQNFLRLAWHLGNRHTDVQIIGGKLRIRRDRVLETMIAGIGASMSSIEAPFEPEAGAHGHHDHAE